VWDIFFNIIFQESWVIEIQCWYIWKSKRPQVWRTTVRIITIELVQHVYYWNCYMCSSSILLKPAVLFF
jgi:hypothetical protein